MMHDLPHRDRRPNWPRLLSVGEAADYLSISATTLREHGPAPKRVGRRVLYDLRDLDRWADRLDDQPLTAAEEDAEAAEIERQFMAERNGRR